MAINLIKNANFGKNKAGKEGSVSYAVYDSEGNTHISRTTTGVYEVVSSSGLYAVRVDLPNLFSGSIVWDVDSKYALDTVDTSEQFTREMTEGRWKIDSSAKQMIFFGMDGSSELARYDLKDSAGAASVEDVFERVSGSA